MVIENDYVTIEEVQQHGRNYSQLQDKLSHSQIQALQVIFDI